MIKFQNPKAILFDLDGVLLDTELLNGEAWRLTAKLFGLELNKEQLKTFLGRRRIDCANDVLNYLHKDIKLSKLLETHFPIQKRLLDKTKAIYNAEKIVNLCFKESIPTALVTSSRSESVDYKIKNHKWIKQIPIRVQGDDLHLKKGKPYPDPYLLASEKLNVNSYNTWAIEDSESGVNSALKAGCSVWIFKKDENDTNIEKLNKSNIKEKIIFINKIEIILNELEKLYQNK